MRGLRVAIDARSVGVVRGIDVAVRADRVVMRQLPKGVVIEGRAQPTGGVVAACGGAVGWETSGYVIRHRAAESDGALPCGYVATVAVHRQISGVVVVHMAGGAWCFGRVRVRSGQRESGGAVVKLSRGPRRNRMARSALRRRVRESSGNVIRDVSADGSRAGPGRLVTAITIRRIQRVVAVDVARQAGSRRR